MNNTVYNNQSFSGFKMLPQVLYDLSNNEFPGILHGFNCKIKSEYNCKNENTYYGYVHEGIAEVKCNSGNFVLKGGMFFSVPGPFTIKGGSGFIYELLIKNFNGFFQVGGPIEEWGRLKYIDGCTDSLLISPIKYGDPCLNALFFPENIFQTQHTHPSYRVGLVAKGRGQCITPEGNIDIKEGMVFIIHEDGIHSFKTESGEIMHVIALHPDSDFGPKDEEHPMINRTIVDGQSAKLNQTIRTK